MSIPAALVTVVAAGVVREVTKPDVKADFHKRINSLRPSAAGLQTGTFVASFGTGRPQGGTSFGGRLVNGIKDATKCVALAKVNPKAAAACSAAAFLNGLRGSDWAEDHPYTKYSRCRAGANLTTFQGQLIDKECRRKLDAGEFGNLKDWIR